MPATAWTGALLLPCPDGSGHGWAPGSSGAEALGRGDHAGCAQRVQLFLSSSFDGIDEEEQHEWPDVFPAGNRKSLTSKMFKAAKNLFNFDNDEKGSVNPADLEIYVQQAREAATRAGAAAAAAQGAAGLALVRERGLVDAVAAADHDWQGTVHAVKVAASQRSAEEAVRNLQATCRQASKLLHQGMAEAEKASRPVSSQRWDALLWKALEPLRKAEELFPKIEAQVPKVHKAQRRLQHELEAAQKPRGPGLLPAGDIAGDLREEAGPEVALGELEPDVRPPIELMEPRWD